MTAVPTFGYQHIGMQVRLGKAAKKEPKIAYPSKKENLWDKLDRAGR
jgi:hypothetical protein